MCTQTPPAGQTFVISTMCDGFMAVLQQCQHGNNHWQELKLKKKTLIRLLVVHSFVFDESVTKGKRGLSLSNTVWFQCVNKSNRSCCCNAAALHTTNTSPWSGKGLVNITVLTQFIICAYIMCNPLLGDLLRMCQQAEAALWKLDPLRHRHTVLIYMFRNHTNTVTSFTWCLNTQVDQLQAGVMLTFCLHMELFGTITSLDTLLAEGKIHLHLNNFV